MRKMKELKQTINRIIGMEEYDIKLIELFSDIYYLENTYEEDDNWHKFDSELNDNETAVENLQMYTLLRTGKSIDEVLELYLIDDLHDEFIKILENNFNVRFEYNSEKKELETIFN